MSVVKTIDIEKVRKEFPILAKQVHSKPLVYLDNAATTQKPQCVIDSLVAYYSNENANIHRGVHTLSQQATIAYENARATVQKFINANFPHEIIFTKGTTDSINLVASSLLKSLRPSPLGEGKGERLEILITEMEHHSNILPWQVLCDRVGASLKIVPITEKGELNMNEFKKMLNPKVKLAAVTQVSNTLGTVNPVKEICLLAHQNKSLVLIDGAQAVPHMRVDVQDLDADFYCFSAHKMYGPTGVGILYGKEQLLNEMNPYQVGGGVIKTVTFEKTIYADLPLKFEAGTPHIEGGLGLAKAINYINEIGIEAIHEYENELLHYATEQIAQIPGVRVIGTAQSKASVLSFVVDGIHPMDIGTLLDQQGVAVRTGHHCTQPLMAKFNIPGTVRASFSFYNTMNEVDVFIKALVKAIKMLK